MASVLLRVGLVALTLISVVAGDASFSDVRTRLSRDNSRRMGPPQKYFHESRFHPHYDGRFADKVVAEHERSPVLKNLMRTFLSTMSDIGAETWIMHGTLLGFYWNQALLPWDDDIDVSCRAETMEYLATYFNMTEYHYQLPGGGIGTYLLEVNPNYIYDTIEDRYNRIDARWIDTNHGLFIDISTIHPDHVRRAQGIEGALIVKDTHRYMESDIFPLRDSFFEGQHVKVPFEYETLLAEEYGEKCFTLTEFMGHRWNDKTKIWEQIVNVVPQEHSRYSGPRAPSKSPPGAPPPSLSGMVAAASPPGAPPGPH